MMIPSAVDLFEDEQERMTTGSREDLPRAQTYDSSGKRKCTNRRRSMNLDCIPISAYCRESGESLDAINKRIQRGVWIEGVQVLKVDGVKERWIDLTEVAKWARKHRDPYHFPEV